MYLLPSSDVRAECVDDELLFFDTPPVEEEEDADDADDGWERILGRREMQLRRMDKDLSIVISGVSNSTIYNHSTIQLFYPYRSPCRSLSYPSGKPASETYS